MCKEAATICGGASKMFAAKARGGSWSLMVERATALKIDFDLLLGILLPLVTRGRREEF